jgi:hypothetical protein
MKPMGRRATLDEEATNWSTTGIIGSPIRKLLSRE